MTYSENIKFSKLNYFDFYLIAVISFLPISIIIGILFVNINILLLNLTLIIYCFKNNIWEWLKTLKFKYLIVVYLYFVLNSIYSFYNFNLDSDYEGVIRSLGFIKFILLIYSFEIFLAKRKIFNQISIIWTIIITVVLIDVFFERITGQNLIGNLSPTSKRIVSFFFDELIVGSFILAFGFFANISLLDNLNKNKYNKFFFNLLFLLIPISIFLTGERANLLKSLFIFFFLLILIDNKNFFFKKSIIIVILIFSFVAGLLLSENIYYKQTALFKRITVADGNNLFEKFSNIKYFSHYGTAFKIFLEHPYTGIGSKNFRDECVEKKYYNKEIKLTQFRCSTHPHQVHFEILAEQGIIGYVIIFGFFILFFINSFKQFIIKNDYLTLFGIFYLLASLLPILPTGSIFSSSNGSFFWIIFSLTNYRSFNLDSFFNKIK